VRATPPGGAIGNVVIMGSAAPAIEELSPMPQAAEPVEIEPVETGPVEVQTAAKLEVNAESLRDAVLNALSNQQMLVSLLESAEWKLEGSSLSAKAAASGTMIEMSFTADARRIASAAATGLAGRPIKVLVAAGGTQQSAPPIRRAPNGSARSRAEQDPIVQKMKEKFGAEIRTVIDYREKDYREKQ
jgi:DNA polymerase-3 subunit gamma/tau